MEIQELQPITSVSKQYDVSTRTLRYYEQIGLLQSSRLPNYAYRAYDAEALARLRQILVLRKLRVPLRQIGQILQNNDVRLALDVFEGNIAAIDGEVEALTTIRDVLATFVVRLNHHLPKKLALETLADSEMLAMVDALSNKTLTRKEERSMKDVDKAEETLARMNDVRIIYLPPSTVASSHALGEGQEQVAGRQLDEFIETSGLPGLKPDFRKFGFNGPLSPKGEPLGYEAWVTIPDDMVVPPPLTKKQFKGGLYAAHMIAMGNFHEWAWLGEWLEKSEAYEGDFAPRYTPNDPAKFADPAMEEQLNAINHLRGKNFDTLQLDLLLPVKEKENKEK